MVDGVRQIEANFNIVNNKVNDDNLGQRMRYRFPKHGTVDQLEKVFVFDLKTYNDQEFAEAYAAGLYDVYRLRDKWDRDSTPEEIQTERKCVIVFDQSCGNPVMNMLKNYEGDERTFIDEDGDEVVSSYRILLLAHNASGFESWVVLNSLDKEKNLKIIKTARGLISLSFRCGVQIINTVEVPEYEKYTGPKSHIKGYLEKSAGNTDFKPNSSKGTLNTRLLLKVIFLIWDIFGSHILNQMCCV